MKLGNRHSQHSFARVPDVNMARSKFDRSHAVKTTMDFDYLTPIFVDEIIPGDTHSLNVKSFIRLAPQVVPVLDNMYIDFFSFFVPNRLTWNNWERFNGAQDDPGDSTDFLIPQTGFSGSVPIPNGSIFDQMGIPPGTYGQNVSFNALPFRAYNLIWNEWFRDENLQNHNPVLKDDGPDPQTEYTLRKRGKRHDYFTSALSWPQKGTAIMMPLGTTAPVTGTVTGPTTNYTSRMVRFDNLNAGDPVAPAGTSGAMTYTGASGPGTSSLVTNIPANTFTIAHNLSADLSDATAATINQFREAIMIQSLLELDARGGTRYVEILRAHFNVISPDFRLQRPEFLGGGTIHIQQHVVAQTSETSADSPQGNLAAFSTAASGGNHIGFSKSFVEHGYVIVLASARADLTYQQGLNRMWNKRTRFEFFWPKLQELGEQTIQRKEIFLVGNTATDNEVFGYQERYAEYRYKPSEIRGQFRSSYAESLDVWHMAEDFSGNPVLNSSFIESSTPIARSLVVPEPTYPDLLCDFWFDLKSARPMVTYGVPATLGRF